MKYHYPITVKFTAYHTSGALEGMETIDEIGFPDVKSSKKWIKDVSRNTGSVKYTKFVSYKN